MSKSLSMFSVVLLGWLAVGCDFQTVAVQNGELPENLVSYVSPYLGTYNAKINAAFSKDQGQVSLGLDGRRVIVTSTMDVVGENCGSSIGDLEQVFVETDSNGVSSIGSATFALNPGRCIEIEGRSVAFERNGENRYSLQILISHQSSTHGGPVEQYKSWILSR